MFSHRNTTTSARSVTYAQLRAAWTCARACEGRQYAYVAVVRRLAGTMWGIRALARRGLATAAKPATAAAASPPPAAGPEVTLPLKLFGLPARYASALYVAAAKAKELPSVEKELLSVVDLAKKEPKFGLFLRDPSASTGDKLKGVASFLEAGKFSATTKNFFGASPGRGRLQPAWFQGSAGPGPARNGGGHRASSSCNSHTPPTAVLAENGRLAEVELIASKFEELMMASRGEVKAVVTSAEVRTNQPYSGQQHGAARGSRRRLLT